MDQQNYIPYREVAKQLNIQEGDQVLLTSDILRLAMKARKKEKEFDLNAFLDSFIEVLGPEGTLLIPAYNFDLESGDPYSIKETEPMTGSLALVAMKRDDFIRTSNPLHSFFVWGKDAPLMAELNNESSFGPDSPFAYLHKRNALMIFAGTTVGNAMTFTHYVEESLNVKYRKYKSIKINYTGSDGDSGQRPFRLYAKKYGYDMVLDKIEQVLSDTVMKQMMISGVSYSMLHCKEVYDIIGKDINENKARSIAVFRLNLYFRDIIKGGLRRLNLFRTTHGKIRSAKRLY